MKKTLLFTIIGLLFSVVSRAQLVTTNPAFITQSGGTFEVIFDATLGDKGLINYSGTDVYAYTGASTATADWVYKPSAWLDNNAKYKLTSLGNNKWKLIIADGINAYYGVPAGVVITKLSFIFRSSTGSPSGRGIGGADIFIPVYQAGLNVSFTNPTADKSVSVGTTETITFTSSITANQLIINGA